jgi:hypothetical protein
VLADVTERSRAQEGVYYCVYDGVGVRVTSESAFGRDGHASKH